MLNTKFSIWKFLYSTPAIIVVNLNNDKLALTFINIYNAMNYRLRVCKTMVWNVQRKQIKNRQTFHWLSPHRQNGLPFVKSRYCVTKHTVHQIHCLHIKTNHINYISVMSPWWHQSLLIPNTHSILLTFAPVGIARRTYVYMYRLL